MATLERASEGMPLAQATADPAFGTLLRQYRVMAGLTQEALAERARMSAVGIRALERGYRATPRFATVDLLADALQLSPDDRERFTSAARRRGPNANPPNETPNVEDAFPPGNLPVAVTSFRGRESQVDRLARLLAERPLVTLCGPGGIGKTRLAIETARALARTQPERFPDGVWLVEFAGFSEPAMLASQIAIVLGIEAEPHVPLVETLVSALRRNRLLLILDNCEHLLEAAATIAHRLITGCPDLRIIATSREPLRIAGERVERVTLLSLPSTESGSLPSIEELLQSPAVRLFLDRAADSAPTFRVSEDDPDGHRALVTVAQRTEGIPLAIELAAARLGSLSLRALAHRLEDRFRALTGGDRTALPHQQTLRATLDWSHDLLAEREQVFFARLGIFAGSWTVDAAESVCSDETISRDDIPELVSSLVDKSLVVAETAEWEAEPRYRLLELMRAYARERLSERPGEMERIARRHAEHYRAVAEQLDGPFGFGTQRKASLEVDLDNYRAALSWALGDEGDPDLGSAIAAPLHDLFFPLSLYAEGIDWCNRGLMALHLPAPRREGDLQRNIAVLSWHLHGPKAAGLAAERAAMLYRELGDRSALTFVLAIRAGTLYLLGERAEADHIAGEALALAREQDEIQQTIFAVCVKCLTTDPRDVVSRSALLEEALILCGHHSHVTGESEAIFQNICGQVAFELGQIARARECGRRGVRAAESNGTASWAWSRLAVYALAAGDLVEAEVAAREALAVFPTMNCPSSIPAVQTLSAVAALRGDLARASRLLGAIDAQLAASERPRDVVEEAIQRQVLTHLRKQLPNEDELARLIAEGAAWGAEQTIDEALAI